MQPPRDFVGVVIKLTAGVKHSHYNLGRRHTFFMHLSRNPAAVVGDADRFIRMNDHRNFRAVACQRLVNGVINQLKYHVVQARAVIRITDVHTRPLPDSIQAFKHLNAVRIVSF